MALLHSRVKEVFYLVPMEKTGGCGGLACLPKLEGVNHRFGISRWIREGENAFDLTCLAIDEKIDA
jgi:tRNA-specific adenosine deaminase 3